MILLLGFAFIAGIVTILSPCILPILPIILSGSLTGGKKRPLGVVTGFVLSFTFFTLFLTTIVKATGIPAQTLRLISVVVVGLFGLTMIIPKIQLWFDQLASRLAQMAPTNQNADGFGGGLLIGLSIGLVWTPCVGPIIASVITLALSGTVTGTAAIIAFTYSLGTAIPMLAITYGGKKLLNRVPWLMENTANIQRAFGVLMILTAVGIYFNVDRRFQAYVLKTFPEYAQTLTQFEDNETIQQQLDRLFKR